MGLLTGSGEKEKPIPLMPHHHVRLPIYPPWGNAIDTDGGATPPALFYSTLPLSLVIFPAKGYFTRRPNA